MKTKTRGRSLPLEMMLDAVASRSADETRSSREQLERDLDRRGALQRLVEGLRAASEREGGAVAVDLRGLPPEPTLAAVEQFLKTLG